MPFSRVTLLVERQRGRSDVQVASLTQRMPGPNHRFGQPRVIVAHDLLEPHPTDAPRRIVGRAERIGEMAEGGRVARFAYRRIGMGEPEHRVRARAQVREALDGLQAAIEKRPAEASPRLGGRIANPVAEPPEGASAAVLRTDLVEPGALVGHEVVKAAVVELRVLQERKVRRRKAQRLLVARRLPQPRQHDDERSRDVVRAVARIAIRNRLGGVLDDAGVVGKHRQMVQRRQRRSGL